MSGRKIVGCREKGADSGSLATDKFQIGSRCKSDAGAAGGCSELQGVCY